MIGMNTRFWLAPATLFVRRKRSIACASCGSPVLLRRNQIHYHCNACSSNLVLKRSYDWLYTAICFAGGLTAAYLQGVGSPMFILLGIVYSAGLIFIAAPFLAPFFPLQLKRTPDKPIITLRTK